MLRLGVLISGAGTNLQAIIDATVAGSLQAKVALVIASRPQAGGLERARQAGIPTLAMSPAVYDRAAWNVDESISLALRREAVDYVVLAGYMRKVLPPLLQTFPNRIVNLHPALLPAFPGAGAIEAAWQRGVKVTGVTVHFVNEQYDEGPIIAQQALIIQPEDSLASLTARIHDLEHQLLPSTLQLLAEGRVSLQDDGRVSIR